MRTVVIVQARMGSSRLPGKALMGLRGRPLITHVLERASLIRADALVLATSDNHRDEALVHVAHLYGAMGWTGSEWDVLGRMRDAAAHTKAELVVRITGDCPFLDPEVANQVIDAFHSTAPDYIWNDTHRSGFPDGLDVEVFTREALELAAQQAIHREDREHVTPWMRRTLRCGVVMCLDGDHSARKLSIDRPEDYAYAQAVYAHLAPAAFTMADTIRACELADIEQRFKSKVRI